MNDDIEARTQTNDAIQAQIAGQQKFADLQAEAQPAAGAAASRLRAARCRSPALLMDISRVIPSDAYLDTSSQITVPAPAATSEPTEDDHRFGRDHHRRRQAVSIDTLATLPDAPGVREGLGEPVDHHDRADDRSSGV